MADIQDALRHPFRDDKLEKEYRRAIRKGTDAMNRALEQGNEEAYAEASEFVRKYKAKLRELERQKWRVQVDMRIAQSGYLIDRLIPGISERRAGNNAMGTPGWGGGWSWVGERGPELMRLPMGSRILDNRASMAVAGGGSTVVNLNVSVPPTADKAAIGRTVMDAIDAALARGHRFRYAPVGGNR
jgi:hypothetical protein